jgi:hypothetical protein
MEGTFKPSSSGSSQEKDNIDGRGTGETRTIRKYTENPLRPCQVREEPIIKSGDTNRRPRTDPAEDVDISEYKNDIDKILSQMGRRFTKTVTTDRAKALRQLQADLMNNLAELSHRTPLPQLIGQSLEIEEILKDSSTNSGLSPLEFTKSWFEEEKKVS